MLENFSWQPIPGTVSSRIYPLERKPNVLCSNTYLIHSDAMFLVIDPGTDSEQINQLVSVIDPEPSSETTPVLILLTHCHCDHIKSTQELMRRLGSRAFLGVQEIGANILREGDTQITLANFYHWQCPQHTIDLDLLTQKDQETVGVREICLDRFSLSLQNSVLHFPEGNSTFCQSFSMGGQDTVYLYHTPGHSPDSLCIQIGDLLFIGDLTFATNPGVIGIMGWSQSDLIQSLETIGRIIENSSIEFCLSGHGRPFPRSKAPVIFHRCLENAQKLENVVVLDMDRARFLDTYAKNLLLEIEDLFSVISGKLLSIAYHLQTLSEENAARELMETIEIDTLDRILSEFVHYAKTYSQETRLEMDIPLRAIQALAKIQECFDEKRLQNVIDYSLLRRVKWLIFDFLNSMQGFREEILGTRENLNHLLLAYLTELRKPVIKAQDLYDASVDENAFTQELIRRISLRNHFESIEIAFNAAIGLPDVYLEKERFCDMLTALLETFVAAGARQLSVSSWQETKKVGIEVKASPAIDYLRFLERKISFVHSIFCRFGGSIRYEKKADQDCLRIELLPASEVFIVE